MCEAAGGVIGLACAAIGAGLVAANPWAAQVWWLTATVVPIAGLTAPRVARWRARGRERFAIDWREAGTIAALLALALAVRLPDLTGSPPFMHGDEAMGGLYGRLFNSGRVPLLSLGWNSLPMASYAVGGVGLRLFGDTMTGLRLINVVVGSLSVVLGYLLGRELFGRRAGLLGALVLAVTFLDVDLSRSGLHDIQGPTCITLTLLLAARWLRRGGAITTLLTGMSLVLDVQVHWSARAAIPLVIALLLYVAVREPQMRKQRWKEGAWLILGIAVSGLPVAALFLANPGSVDARDVAVSIFNHGEVAHVRSVYGTTDPLVVFANQVWRTWSTFYVRGDSSTLIDRQGGMFDTVGAALLVPALVLALRRWKQWPYALCLAWFGAVAAASILTLDPPWWPRLAALVPAAALCMGALLAEATRFLQRTFAARRRWATLGLCLILVTMAIGNLRLVFYEYPLVERQSPMMEGTVVAQFLAAAPGAGATVLLSDGTFNVDATPILFLAPHAHGCTLRPGMPLPACPLARTSRLFVLLPGRVRDLPRLERQRPGGKTVLLGTFNGGASRIVAYELPATPQSR